MAHPSMPDGRIASPSCERNKDVILEVLQEFVEPDDRILEVGTYTGQHAAYFSKHLDVDWQPTDVNPLIESIQGWAKLEGAERVAAPFALDLFNEFPEFDADVLVCINAIHIAPWPATKRLFELGTKVLKPGGHLMLYGPFEYRGQPLEPSNIKFNAWLESHYPGGGIRVFEAINEIAEALGYSLVEDRTMPANNHAIYWHR